MLFRSPQNPKTPSSSLCRINLVSCLRCLINKLIDTFYAFVPRQKIFAKNDTSVPDGIRSANFQRVPQAPGLYGNNQQEYHLQPLVSRCFDSQRSRALRARVGARNCVDCEPLDLPLDHLMQWCSICVIGCENWQISCRQARGLGRNHQGRKEIKLQPQVIWWGKVNIPMPPSAY